MFVTLSEKKRLTNLQQLQLQNNFFSSVYVIGTTNFDKSFLFHVITFYKKLSLPRGSFYRDVVVFFETSDLKEIRT